MKCFIYEDAMEALDDVIFIEPDHKVLWVLALQTSF